jgi:alpha-mannosidase
MNGNDHVLPQRALNGAVRQTTGRLNGTALRLARLDDYLAVLPADGWPRWRGELRSSARANVLMGTLSVRTADKQLYTRAVRSLERLAEPAAALTGTDVDTELQAAWTLILQNAAHDTACGSGIDAVAEASRRRSETALRIADEVADTCLPHLAGQGQIWNPSAFARQAVIDVGSEPCLTPLIPACSVAMIDSVSPTVSVTVGPSRMENAYLEVVLNRDATISVLDKQRHLRFEAINRLVDEGDAGDEYNFSPPEANPAPAQPVRGLRTSIVERWAARGRLQAQFDYAVYSGLSDDRRRRTDREVLLPVRLLLSLDADIPRLDIDLQLDNRATDHRLRVHHPLPFPVSSSAADTPYHVTRRPVRRPFREPGAPEVELPTYPMWSFVDCSDDKRGLSVIADGLHEYEVLPGPPAELAITLLRAVGWLSRDDLSMRTGHAGPEVETPGAQVQGTHHFRYSLFFHLGDWEAAGLWRRAESALVPLRPGRGEPRQTPPPLIELLPDSIQMTACLPMPGGYQLRLLNASDRPQHATVRLRPLPRHIELVDLAGRIRERLSTDDEAVTLPMRPWEISTLRVSR